MAEENPRSRGTVTWFNDQKGFGFIRPDDEGEDLFVHQSAIISDGFRTLQEGQTVEFRIALENDCTKAIQVTGPNGSSLEKIRSALTLMVSAVVGVTTVGRMATWLGIVPGRGVALVAAGLVITSASLGIWQEIAIAAVAAAEPLVVAGVPAIIVEGKGTWLGSALVPLVVVGVH